MNQADLSGYAIGYINFAPFLIRTTIIDANQFKLSASGIDQPNDRPEGKVGVGSREGLGVKALPVGRLAAVEFGSIPAGIADPSLNRLGRFSLIGYERCFHHWCDKEHQWHPAYCSPNHEEWLFHSVVFLLQFTKKCSRKASLCQPISVRKVPLNLLILNTLMLKRAERT